jgi:YD repeat-containing protein
MRVHPGVVSLICALLLTIGSAMVAQHHREARQHELQVALELALRSDAIRGSSPSLSARLALTAYALGRTDAADDAVSASLAGYGRHFSSFGRVVSAAFNADGRLLAVTDADGTIRVWDVDSGRLTTEVASGSPGRAQSVAFDDGGTLMVAAADRYGRVQVLSGASPVRALVLNTGSRNSVDSLAFGPDARKLATSESDGSVRLWDLGLTGGRRSALRLAGTGGTAMAFSSDGRMLAIVGSDGTLRLWDTGTGRLTGSPLTAARAVVDAMAFSPDGRMLATAAGDATVRLWDVRSGSPVGVRVTGHDGTVAAMSFSPDGRSLATAAPSGVRLWDVDSYLDPVAGLCDKVGGLSRRQWAHYVPERGYRDICAQPDRSQGT